MTERFKKSRLRDVVRSSEGYRIRVAGRTGINYRDDQGMVHVDSETMNESPVHVVVNGESIPDLPPGRRDLILARIARAFDHAGWRLS
ncbi:hypothetical protein [Cellulomonas chengniuliangii]|uniref:Uncharacterized protein n=1 Tax=Cellulomonas chengniuliangii TaxID=2968084 RepID=A0ABY5KXP7_9CELL|nr:hypothetical protein [Cellulomonas chengniuliangii]MCC2309978.1 hypothetical protein [Cellulomonas chengniuliangii]UUI74623.1 hypothetical protein NP064_12575 [Cellulomonas chengniuliangii]